MEEHGGVVPAFADTARSPTERAPRRGARAAATRRREPRRRRAASRERVRRAADRDGGRRAAASAAEPEPPPVARPSRRPRQSRRRRPRQPRPTAATATRDRARQAASRSRKRQRQPQEAREAMADEHARLGDDGDRDLALHGVRARPLLGRDRRRLPGRDRSARSCSASWSRASPSRARTTPTSLQALIAVPGAADRARRSSWLYGAPRGRRAG